MIKFKLIQPYKNIFQVSCRDSYDLSMIFCRAQEFYESPLFAIKGKHFDIFTFQKLYSKHFGDGVFSYALDWCGFNIPGHILDKFFTVHPRGYEQSEYDKVFSKIIEMIYSLRDKASKYYLIGAHANDSATIQHELCHAFYYINTEYKQKVDAIIKTIDNDILSSVKELLLRKGYNKNVIFDEINAYFSTDYSYIFDNIKISKEKKKNTLKIVSLLEEEFQIQLKR